MKIAALIPAYNEQKTIADVVQSVLKHVETVVVVDDGSTDDTVERIQSLPVTIIRNDKNLGKGVSLLTGFKKALQLECDAVIALDADGQHDPQDIPRLINAHQEYPEHMIIAARMKDTHLAPRPRLIANRVSDFFVSWVAGQKIYDSQSGFRLYPKEVLEMLADVEYNERFGFETEVLIDLAGVDVEFIAVPIKSCYPDEARASHYKGFRDTAVITRIIVFNLFKKWLNIPGLFRILFSRGIVFEG
ncbi:MAG: glycosyltransferase family 2 protein [Gammaproteobacteria bacterium]